MMSRLMQAAFGLCVLLALGGCASRTMVADADQEPAGSRNTGTLSAITALAPGRALGRRPEPRLRSKFAHPEPSSQLPPPPASTVPDLLSETESSVAFPKFPLRLGPAATADVSPARLEPADLESANHIGVFQDFARPEEDAVDYSSLGSGISTEREDPATANVEHAGGSTTHRASHLALTTISIASLVMFRRMRTRVKRKRALRKRALRERVLQMR